MSTTDFQPDEHALSLNLYIERELKDSMKFKELKLTDGKIITSDIGYVLYDRDKINEITEKVVTLNNVVIINGSEVDSINDYLAGKWLFIDTSIRFLSIMGNFIIVKGNKLKFTNGQSHLKRYSQVIGKLVGCCAFEPVSEINRMAAVAVG